VTDVNGGVYTTLGGSGWSSVVQPQGTAAPGSPVNLGGNGHLFVTSPQGEVLFTRPVWT
jgi:hypothetical protein